MLAEMYVKIRLSEEERFLRAQKLHASDVDASKRLSLQVRKPHGRTVCNLKTKFEMLRRIGELFRSTANRTPRQPQLGDTIFTNLIARNAPSPTCPTDLNQFFFDNGKIPTGNPPKENEQSCDETDQVVQFCKFSYGSRNLCFECLRTRATAIQTADFRLIASVHALYTIIVCCLHDVILDGTFFKTSSTKKKLISANSGD